MNEEVLAHWGLLRQGGGGEEEDEDSSVSSANSAPVRAECCFAAFDFKWHVFCVKIQGRTKYAYVPRQSVYPATSDTRAMGSSSLL